MAAARGRSTRGSVKVLAHGVVLVELRRGQSTKPTDHAQRYLVIPLTNGSMRRDVYDGETTAPGKVIKLKAYGVYRRDDPKKQSVVNVGKTLIRFLKVPLP